MRHRASLALVTALISVSCNDLPTPPTLDGVLRVIVNVSGGDPDVDGFVAVIDSDRRQRIPSSGNWAERIPPGEHSISLDEVAPNCVVEGGGHVLVLVTAGWESVVRFSVSCAATGVLVSVRSDGADHFTIFRVLVHGQMRGTIGPNATQLVSRVQPGNTPVVLLTPTYCTVESELEVVASVINRSIAQVMFDVTCTAPSRQIAYMRFDGDLDGQLELVQIGLAGEIGLGLGSWPAWSPSGDRLLFADHRACIDFCEAGGVFILNLKTQSIVRVPDSDGGVRPAWSVKDEIAFARHAPGVAGIWVGRSAGTGLRRLDLPVTLQADRVSWSADGQHIAFTCTVAGTNRDICVVARDGGDFRVVVSGPRTEDSPAFSPDGKWLAFMQANLSGSSRIMLLDLFNGDLIDLTAGYHPTWSPDSDWIAFSDNDGIFAISVEGTGLKRLTTGSHFAPAWRP